MCFTNPTISVTSLIDYCMTCAGFLSSFHEADDSDEEEDQGGGIGLTKRFRDNNSEPKPF